MALHNAGLLMDSTFLRVALTDMRHPHLLTKSEQLLVLRHNIAWEHYLFNFTNFISVVALVEPFVVDVEHVHTLFPLPTRWPWVTTGQAPHTVENFRVDNLDAAWVRWRDTHDVLYLDP
jgi:hypothetical protein